MRVRRGTATNGCNVRGGNFRAVEVQEEAVQSQGIRNPGRVQLKTCSKCHSRYPKTRAYFYFKKHVKVDGTPHYAPETTCRWCYTSSVMSKYVRGSRNEYMRLWRKQNPLKAAYYWRRKQANPFGIERDRHRARIRNWRVRA